jgi:RNA polymerase sigma factor (sigma-70 family)
LETKINELATHLFRENSGKMIAVLNQRYGYQHVDLTLDVLQDTFEAALTNWKFKGVPQNPSAWLMKVAIHKMLNELNKQRRSERRETSLRQETEASYELLEEANDSQMNLLLFFSQLHISVKNKIMLTLYYLCGFGYPEMANALLTNEEAVKKVILRHKEELKRFKPDDDYQRENFTVNLPVIRQVLYLLFNEGYKTTRKQEGINADLCYEAMRLCNVILSKIDDGSTHALLALMFLNVSRFPARKDQHMDWIMLEAQDRSLWDRQLMAEGFAHLNKAAKCLQVPDRFYLEALISSVHCSSLTFKDTDWQKIALLHRQLEALFPETVAYKLNRIIAECHMHISDQLLKELDSLALLVKGPYVFFYYLCKAYIYDKLDRAVCSLKFYEAALNLARSRVDKRFVEGQISKLKYRQQTISSHNRP